nr:hypothetical protein CFP56_54807 [Quercus suber]
MDSDFIERIQRINLTEEEDEVFMPLELRRTHSSTPTVGDRHDSEFCHLPSSSDMDANLGLDLLSEETEILGLVSSMQKTADHTIKAAKLEIMSNVGPKSSTGQQLPKSTETLVSVPVEYLSQEHLPHVPNKQVGLSRDVAHGFIKNEDTRQWDRGKVFATFAQRTCEEILEMPLSNVNSRDVLVWQENKAKKFTVRTAYRIAVRMKNPSYEEHSLAQRHGPTWGKI